MTPASPLSRLEKLAKEKYPRMYSCRGAAMFGAKTILQILSEPGEACGPREEEVPNRIWVKGLNGKYCLNTSIATPLEGWSYPKEGSTEYCDLRELTQARAALASSEARVRILSTALMRISDTREHPGSKRIAEEALLEVQR